MQKGFIIGNVTRAPEIKQVGSSKVCTFNVAVNSKEKDIDVATFYRINAWGALGDLCYKFVVKGMKCAITGDLRITAFVQTDGEAKPNIDIRADNVEFLNSPSGTSGGAGGARAAKTPPPAAAKKTTPAPEEDEDELPF